MKNRWLSSFFSNLIWNCIFIFISGLRDGRIVVWNPLETDETKQKRILPQKHSHYVISLSFSPDGRFLASGDRSGKIIIWSTKVRNWRGKMCHWLCAVCCCPFTSRNGLYRVDAHLFHPFHFSFFSLPFLDLDASFHRPK